MATAGVDGLDHGLDTTKIIDGLLSVYQQRIDLLQARKKTAVDQQTSFKSIDARLLALQGQISRLARSQNNLFDIKKVTTSDDQLLTASGSASAANGTYALRINALAQAHQLASQGFESVGSAITQGTIQIRVGTGVTRTVTIDSTNNTLEGLAGAINSAGAGVTATIISDGSDARTQPYRLLLTSNGTGTTQAISIVNNLAADGGGALRPELSSTYLGPAVTGSVYTGTSTPTANSGAGTYTGAANKTYTFTVVSGGTVGLTDGVQIAYADSQGVNSGTLTLSAGDADAFKTVAEGLQVKLSAGTLVAGETFTVDAFAPTIRQAVDASVTVGSGPGALTVLSQTNQLDGLIPGVTFNLLGSDNTRDVTVTVANDTDPAEKAVLDFVDSYNDLMAFIDDQVRFDAASGNAGLLLGNRTVTSFQDDIRSAVNDVVSGVNQSANRLSTLGITTTDEGHLEVDQSKLHDALSGRLSGVTIADVRRLFAFSGSSTSSGVEFVTGSSRTKASSSPYQLDISQVAERALVAAATALASSTVIDGTNNTLTLTIDGRASGTIALTPGTYTRLALANELAAQINNDAGLADKHVNVTLQADQLTLTSDTFGLASEVTFGAGTAWGALGFLGSESDKGQDVAGKFIVDGTDEPATGSGQFLVGNVNNANTADLQVHVTLAAGQLTADPEANLTVTRGIASRLDSVLNRILDPVSGRLKSVDDGFEAQINAFDDGVKRQTDIMNSQRDTLLRQFVALESTVAQLRTTGDFLAAQLNSVNNTKKK